MIFVIGLKYLGLYFWLNKSNMRLSSMGLLYKTTNTPKTLRTFPIVSIKDWINKLRDGYVTQINNNCLPQGDEQNDLAYWQDRLFATILQYFLPFSLLTIIPGVIVSMAHDMFVLAISELTAFATIIFICFYKAINVRFRKWLFISVIYLIAICLFYYLGNLGPGMLYFLACTFFTVLIFPEPTGYWSVVANVGISIAFGLLFYTGAVKENYTSYDLPGWIAVSSNLIILSLIIVLMQPKLFKYLLESSERYKIVTKATNDTIWEWDINEGKMLYSSGIYDIFGYPQQEITNHEQWWVERVHPDDKERVVHEFGSFFLEQRNLKIEYRFRCADNTYKYVQNTATVITDEKGIPVKMIGALQDISANKNYINDIEKQNRHLKKIAWVQSHKVRGPLATILGLSNLLEPNAESVNENKTVIEGIIASCKQLDDVIGEINQLTEV